MDLRDEEESDDKDFITTTNKIIKTNTFLKETPFENTTVSSFFYHKLRLLRMARIIISTAIIFLGLINFEYFDS